jgi:hypothetical protein
VVLWVVEVVLPVAGAAPVLAAGAAPPLALVVPLELDPQPIATAAASATSATTAATR